MTRSLCALALLLGALSTLRAGERLVIVPTTDRQPGLILPSDWLAQHRAGRQEVPGSHNPALPTIIAGAALTFGLILTGMLLVRRCSARFAAGATACCLAGLLLVNSSCSSNNDRDNYRHPVERAIYGPTLQEDGTLQGEVLLEAGSSSEALRLVIDPNALESLEKHHAAMVNP